MKGLGLIAVFLFALTANAFAQYVQQTTVPNPPTAGHPPVWVRNGIIGDPGPATNSTATEFGLTKNGGLPFCIRTSPTNTYALMCMSISDSAAALSIQGYNEATPNFCIIINNICYSVTGGGSSTALRVIPSGSSDTATTSDGTLAWSSSATLNKTESLYACTSAQKSLAVTIVDEIGTAGTYPIAVTPNGINTINNAAINYISINNASLTIQCDGNGNWIVL